MVDRLKLSYGSMLATRLGGRGIPAAALTDFAPHFDRARAHVEQLRAGGELGFLALPHESTLVEQIRRFADGVGQAFDTVVVLGIGGSALGTTMLQQALRPARWNELDDEAREYYPRLFVLDNVDPATIGPLLSRLDMRRTLFNVISKSGATSETMAQYMIVREQLQAELGEDGYRRHLIFTTDPERGVLRQLAAHEHVAALPVPPAVGGRFSVLAAVGLLPAALVGIDIERLLAGAAAMVDRCQAARLEEHPAALYAALQYLAHTTCGAPIHVMMPYADGLDALGAWFRQLWAESLGKRFDREGREVFRGPTPVRALGATDQHSQVQLYMEGPFDKTVTFVYPRERSGDIVIPASYAGTDELGYLGGRTLGQLLDAERAATTAALTQAGRMNMTIELPRLDAHAIGQLIMMLQLATVFAGEFYDVDPLDQPGVELGKQLTYGLMGRAGFAPPDTGHDDDMVCA
jgi:glucose-6-phosphate isomerase